MQSTKEMEEQLTAGKKKKVKILADGGWTALGSFWKWKTKQFREKIFFHSLSHLIGSSLTKF